MTSTVVPSATQSITVEVSQPTAAVATDGMMKLAIVVSAEAPTDYLEVRVRLKGPSGRLVYQKTEARSGLPAGRHVIEYEHDLTDLGLTQGRYPIEVRVLATDVKATTVADRLLVVDADTPPLPVAVVVRAVDVPCVTLGGQFSRDPSEDSLRDDLAFVVQLALERGKPLALAIPPVLLEQYARAAAGYETTAGVIVAPTDEPALRAARMLQALRSAVATGTIDMVDVPYALPDLAGLRALGGGSDLDLHWGRTDTVIASVLHSTTTPSLAYIGSALTRDGIVSASSRGASCMLAPAAAVRSEDETATPGCYTIENQGMKVLVFDERAAAGAHSGSAEFYDALFDRLEDGAPTVIALEVGPGAANTPVDAQHALDWIADASWLRLASVDALARTGKTPVATLSPLPASDAPRDYWARLKDSRAAALAYASAAGAQDIDAAAGVWALLVSESSLWAGPDDSWDAAGLALAQSAREFVESQFALIRLDAKDVTLSGSKGNVPLTLLNDTGKNLRLTLDITASSAAVSPQLEDIDVRPTQNFLTIPVNLGNALSDDLLVTVRSGEIVVAEATVGVRASYIDRLATLAMVIIVLVALLVFIRRRMTRTAAVAIVGDSNSPERTTSRK